VIQSGTTTPVYVPPLDGSHGVIWPRISADGKRLVWAEMYGLPYYADFNSNNVLGYWQLKSAPLANLTTAIDKTKIVSFPSTQPSSMTNGAAFYEPYGFAPNGDIIFSSSYGNTTSQLANQIYFINPALGSAVPR